MPVPIAGEEQRLLLTDSKESCNIEFEEFLQLSLDHKNVIILEVPLIIVDVSKTKIPRRKRECAQRDGYEGIKDRFIKDYGYRLLQEESSSHRSQRGLERLELPLKTR